MTGVFVNENTQKVCDITKHIPLDIVRLHGDETKRGCKQIKTTNRDDSVESLSSRSRYKRNT
ncbi:hypothetical protein ACEQPO_17430 [Bacillus sp. SL00103]